MRRASCDYSLRSVGPRAPHQQIFAFALAAPRAVPCSYEMMNGVSTDLEPIANPFSAGGEPLVRIGTRGVLVLPPYDAETSDFAGVVRAAGALLGPSEGRWLVVVSRPGDDDGPAWLPGARVRFEQFCDGLGAAVEGAEGFTPVIWPLASGTVSDVPSLGAFLRKRPNWRFILDPAGMLTPDMLPLADDHLMRIFEGLREHSQLCGLVAGEPRVVGERVVADANGAPGTASKLAQGMTVPRFRMEI